MQARKIDTGVERQILIGLIVSDGFAHNALNWRHQEYLATPFTRTVAQWCVEHYQSYKKAPGRDIQNLYEHHRRNGLPEDQADLIEDFLESISKEFEHGEKFNVDFALDRAGEYYQERALKTMAEDVQACLSRGDLKAAQEAAEQKKGPEESPGQSIKVLSDADGVVDVFDNDSVQLFKAPGILGDFIGDFERETLIGVMAPEKRGKTFWLTEMAFWAMRYKCNVAFFSAGDLSKRQQLKRMYQRTALCSKRGGPAKVPLLDCMLNQRDECDKRERAGTGGAVLVEKGEGKWQRMKPEQAPDHVPCTECLRKDQRGFKGAVWHEVREFPALTPSKAIKACRRAIQRHRGREIMLDVYPNRTLTVKTVDQQLERWAREGWVADVVIVDYADIMAPEDARVVDVRHRKNETWMALRRLSQERHCCVITATQTDAKAYGQWLINSGNFSEDKRAYGHVNMMLTLNQMPREKEDRVLRLGRLFVREEYFDERHTVTVLQHLDTGRAYLGSYWS